MSSDFRSKYSLLDSRSEQVRLFILKLPEKKQSPEQQKQATHALSLFFESQPRLKPGPAKPANVNPEFSNIQAPPAEISVSVLKNLSHPCNLVVKLLYGCGLRLFEGVKLRVKDFNFADGVLTVRGKGNKSRTVPIPQKIFPELMAQLEVVKDLHDKDIVTGYTGVFLDDQLEKKYPKAAKELIWQWFFPQQSFTFVAEKKEKRRYHLHEKHVQEALYEAVRMAKLTKCVTSHTFRHSFATHLLQVNYDIHTIQTLLGHSDVRTTMIYTHCVPSRTIKDSKSPLDF